MLTAALAALFTLEMEAKSLSDLIKDDFRALAGNVAANAEMGESGYSIQELDEAPEFVVENANATLAYSSLWKAAGGSGVAMGKTEGVSLTEEGTETAVYLQMNVGFTDGTEERSQKHLKWGPKGSHSFETRRAGPHKP